MALVTANYDAETRIWTGPKHKPFYDYNCSLGYIIFRAMKNYPKNICQINDTDGKILTNDEAITWAIRIAQHFKKMQIKQEDVIGIIAKNSTYVLSTAIACQLNCSPFHAVNFTLDQSNIAHIFGLTKPKVIFCDGGHYEKVFLATKNFKPVIYTLTGHVDGVPSVVELLEPTQTEQLYRPEVLQHGGDQTIAVLCSAGTTGPPKAVCLSNHTFFFYQGYLTNEDVIFSASTLDWYTGTFCFYLTATQGCTRIITNKRFSPELYVELVKKYNITFSLLQPRYAALLTTCPIATPEALASVRKVMVTGGFVNKPTIKKVKAIFKNATLIMVYGFTEAGWVAEDFGMVAPGSVGTLQPDVSARIVGEDGNNLGPNQVGEICCHTNRGWNGYYGNPSQTARVRTADGWLFSGDIGYFDQNNFLFIVDRKKDTLKSHGLHYWPSELENAIAELPDIVDVCVVAVHDPLSGDNAGAVVVKNQGSTLTESAIQAHVANEIPGLHKQLKAGVVFVDKLPYDANGKLLRKDTKDLFMAMKIN